MERDSPPAKPGRRQNRPLPFPENPDGKEDRLIQTAQDWIAQHVAQPDVLKQARQRSGLIPRTFDRRFKSATGIAPIKFVQRLRVDLAKDILTSQPVSIENIAGEVGYGDPSSFRRLFTRLVGMTPGAYRKRFGSDTNQS